MRNIIRIIAMILLRTLTGIGSVLVSLYGLYMFAFSGFVQEALGTAIFCLLPMFSFPVFLFGFWRLRAATIAHWLLAIAYLISFTQMDWRTCSERSACSSIAATIAGAFTVHPVEGAFAVAILSLAALALRRKPQPRSVT